VIWTIVQDRLKRGNEPATINRLLSVVRNLLRIARDEWQWIDVIPKIRMLPGESQRDRWLTREQADRLIESAKPHLQAMIRFALATGCRAREITGLQWDRVDLKRATAWLDQTKNGTPRGVPLNADAVAVLEAEVGKHPVFCFTYRGEPIAWELTNSAWHHAVRKAGITDFRFHDLRHTWASWHRQAGTSCDETSCVNLWSRWRAIERRDDARDRRVCGRPMRATGRESTRERGFEWREDDRSHEIAPFDRRGRPRHWRDGSCSPGR
jgi:integrase